jgi:acyl carrier protein
MMKTRRELVDDLAGLLRHFQGREYSGPIGPTTRFFADLGFSSIDAVVLAESLEERHQRTFPFHEFLAELRERRVMDIEIGELACFLERHWQ